MGSFLEGISHFGVAQRTQPSTYVQRDALRWQAMAESRQSWTNLGGRSTDLLGFVALGWGLWAQGWEIVGQGWEIVSQGWEIVGICNLCRKLREKRRG